VYIFVCDGIGYLVIRPVITRTTIVGEAYVFDYLDVRPKLEFNVPI